MTGLASYFFGRPAAEELYTGLDRQDGGRIAESLKESDISFAVNSDGKPVLVRDRESAPALFGKLKNMTGDSIPPANSGYICRSLKGTSSMAKPARPALPPGRAVQLSADGSIERGDGAAARSFDDGRHKGGHRSGFRDPVEEAQLANQMHEHAPSWSLAQVVAAIQALRGVALIAAIHSNARAYRHSLPMLSSVITSVSALRTRISAQGSMTLASVAVAPGNRSFSMAMRCSRVSLSLWDGTDRPRPGRRSYNFSASAQAMGEGDTTMWLVNRAPWGKLRQAVR
jgi:hypothetical protein